MSGPTALIIGTSSGIGKGLLKLLSRSHYTIGSSHTKSGSNIISLDLCKKNTISTFINKLKKKLLSRKIDVLILNSGVSYPTSILHAKDEEIEMSFSLNTTNQIILVRELIPYLNDGSKIIYINSKSSIITLPFLGIYAASKSANLSIAEALRIELSPFKISVSSICLGNTKTAMWINNFKKSASIIHQNSSYKPQITKPLIWV